MRWSGGGGRKGGYEWAVPTSYHHPYKGKHPLAGKSVPTHSWDRRCVKGINLMTARSHGYLVG